MCVIKDTYEFNSVDMAKYIVAYANHTHVGINMTKLQKLLYIAYGAALVILNKRLVNEHPQAWPYGPVFPTTRNKLRKIDFSDINFENDSTLKKIKDNKDVAYIVDFTFKGFGDWHAYTLSQWSHQSGSPWDKTVHSENFKWGKQISDYDIRDWFKERIYKEE